MCLKTRMVAMPKQADKTVDEIAQQRLNTIPAGRFGDPLDTVSRGTIFAAGLVLQCTGVLYYQTRTFLKMGTAIRECCDTAARPIIRESVACSPRIAPNGGFK